MANLNDLPKPPKKGNPPMPSSSVNNLARPALNGNVPLQLKISPDTRRDFKSHALAQDMDANELFAKVWAYYKENHG